MSITTKALVTRRVDSVSERAILYFPGQFWTSDEQPDFAKDRLWVDFEFGLPEGTMIHQPKLDNIRWEHPYTEYKVWPCTVGLWHDKSVVDVKYDFDEPPVKVYPRILQPGQTWDDIDWDTWSE